VSEEFVDAIQHARLDKSILGVTQGEPVVQDVPERDDAAEGSISRLLLTAGVRTLVNTPLIHKDQTLGTLSLGTRQHRVFPSQELALLASIGQQIGVGVKNAWLYASVQQELTERKRAEAQLQQYAAKLEDANEELSQYAYVVSHDLKTPLRAVHNYADFLTEDLEGTLAEDQQMYLDGLGRAVQEAEELVDDLLELSRIGRRHVTVEEIDVGAFLREQIATLGLSTGVEIIMPDEWPTMNIEMVLFGQIFQNLITNGIKFNDSANKRLELGWRQVEQVDPLNWDVPAGEGYEFFVRDNGIGIEPRYHAQIFRVFERLHTKEEYEGTGIGLAIVKKAVSKLGGSVRVESQLGEGSTFFVTIPKTRKEDQT
jgi:light-regulated signal transduction histidine kinase (bacteriophytochrome)